ncbi:glycosyltransferase family 4 protein [Methylobacterium sp. P31]
MHFHNTFPLISPAAYYAASEAGTTVVQTLDNYRLVCVNALLFREGRVCEDCLGKTVAWSGIKHGCYRSSRAASAIVASMQVFHRAKGTWRDRVDAYIALNDASRRKFIVGGLPNERIAVKPNFLHIDPGQGAGSGDYALFVGRLSKEKGLPCLLDAWSRLEGRFPLKIVGDGPLRSLVESHARADQSIEYLGPMSQEAVLQIVGEARLLIQPSECYETWPRVIVEAFAKGTPVLASNLGAMAEMVDHGRTGWLFSPEIPKPLQRKPGAASPTGVRWPGSATRRGPSSVKSTRRLAITRL